MKKPYVTPRLVTHGDFKRIIQGGSGRKSDGQPGQTKHCWIAEALYGACDPRTTLLRGWMSTVYIDRRAGWWLVSAYRKFGERIAKAIGRSLVLRTGFRVLFDVLVLSALGSTMRAQGVALQTPHRPQAD